MAKNRKFFWIVPASLFGVLGLAFILQGFGLISLKFWGPQFVEARREIFEESQSFVHGKVTHLNRLRLDYEAADTESRRKALRRMILTEAAVLEEENLPAELALFLDSLRTVP
jgi:hypothetical protein